MTYTEKRLEINWQEVPNQIGTTLNIGTNHTYIESRLNDEERKGIRNLIEFSITQALAEERESVRAVIEKLIEGNDAGLWGCRESFDKLLASLQDNLTEKE